LSPDKNILFPADIARASADTRLAALNNGIVGKAQSQDDLSAISKMQGVAIMLPIRNGADIIRQADVTLIAPFIDRELHRERVQAYCNAHFSAGQMGGGGMIASLRPDEWKKYIDAVGSIRESMRQDGDQQQVLDQPILLHCRTKEEAISNDVRDKVEEGLVSGIIVPDERYVGVYTANNADGFEDTFLGARGNLNGMRDLLVAYDPDLLLLSDHIRGVDAHTLNQQRLYRYGKNNKDPLFDSPSSSDSLRIGMVSLQGAYRLEEAMLREAAKNFNYNIEVVRIKTRAEMSHLDAIFLPGGWHAIQEEYYGDNRTDIMRGVRDMMKEGRHAFFSCAGAILARDEKRTSVGCSAGTAHNFMPFGVINNALTGIMETRMQFSGRELLVPGVFSAGPKFIEHDNLTTIGRVGSSVIALLEKRDNGGVHVATSLHSVPAVEAWYAGIKG